MRKCPPWSEPTLQKPKCDKKKLYNAKVKEQLLEVGDEVLVLLPMKQNKLKLQWSGPYQITRKVTPVNYKAGQGQEKKVYHVNCLKKWH